jgi:ribosome recycling factor
MTFNFNPLKQKLKETEDWLRREFTQIRTGRATPAILDGVKVESYGTQMPINQLATVSVEEARSLRIAPWDVTNAKAIEKAITSSDLGLSVALDDKGLRITFPELTSERRTSFVKLAKQKLEDAKVTIRNEREKTLKDIEKEEKDGKISQDEKFRLRTDLQKTLDEGNLHLDEMFVKKEKEILE